MDERTGWLTAAAALLGPIGVLLSRWWDRRDSRDKTTLDWREKRETHLYDRQDAQLDRAYKRVEELEASERQLEGDRDLAWSVARAWFEKAHEVNHAYRGCLQALPLDMRAEWLGRAIVLPKFREIVTGKNLTPDSS